MVNRFIYCFCAFIISISSGAYAHNVIGGVYAIGNQVEGEVGFSNGDMAKAGTLVQVENGNGERLGETQIGDDGMFFFTASKAEDHYFVVDMSSGHIARLHLPADEITLPEQTGSAGSVVSRVDIPSATPALTAQQIEQAVARQIKPLRQELAAYQAKANLQNVLGGIGYIFGICGLGIWWQNRQQKKAHMTNSHFQITTSHLKNTIKEHSGDECLKP
ncbi:hypothetical protein [Oceanospirillum maris]|uniref:hypothetical protein n=1 Tax=Oceanospirillum maris TaxID=64977 RepID=UPI000415E85E|nr:hypothetical protein [Oceanospirillum maris]